MAITPFKLSIGSRKIGQSDTSSSANLGRLANVSFAQIQANFMEFIDHMENFTAEALRDALEPTLELSWEYCPVDTGELLASSYLEVENFRGQPRVEMGYAKGGRPNYAIYVHEIPTYAHEAPTSHKFLQRAIDEDYFSIIQRIVQNVRATAGT